MILIYIFVGSYILFGLGYLISIGFPKKDKIATTLLEDRARKVYKELREKGCGK